MKVSIDWLQTLGGTPSEYFYQWIKAQIQAQFDPNKKMPPYTFADFKYPYAHIERRPFYDLYVIGTDLSRRSSVVFSYETTPDMEVAEAVRISMSIPLFFEAVKLNVNGLPKDSLENVFCDGGMMWNYPINIFDTTAFQEQKIPGANPETLGVRFFDKVKYYDIDNLLSYIKNLYFSQLRVQEDSFNHSPHDIQRSIQIDTGDVSPVDFDISTGDETYQFLYRQGYYAAKNYCQGTENLMRFN